MPGFLEKVFYGALGAFLFFLLVGVLDKYGYLNRILDYFGIP